MVNYSKLLTCISIFSFILLTSCYKAERVLTISQHKWKVASGNSPQFTNSTFHFMDNRLFFYTSNSGDTSEGSWDFANEACTALNILCDNQNFNYATIIQLSKEHLDLEMSVFNSSQTDVSLNLVPTE